MLLYNHSFQVLNYFPFFSEAEPSPPPKRKRGRPRRNLINNEDSTTPPHKCSDCGKTFNWLKDLARHTKYSCLNPVGKFFQCNYCTRSFKRKDNLQEHVKLHENPKGSGRGLRPPRHPEWNFAKRLYAENSFAKMQCMLCEQSFKSVQKLRQHMLVHADRKTLTLHKQSDVVLQLYAENTMSLSEIISEIIKNMQEQHFNKYCNIVNEFGYEMCLSDSDAEPENDSALNVNRYKCELCHEVFSRKHKVFAHMKLQHSSATLPYQCSLCQLKFVCEPMYALHMRSQCANDFKKLECSSAAISHQTRK